VIVGAAGLGVRDDWGWQQPWSPPKTWGVGQLITRRGGQWNSCLSSLRDDDDITARNASATAAMGALKEIWRNPHLDIYNKYLLFRAIPMNLLLWGAETWSLRKSQHDQLKVFLHRSIRRILQISMTKVREDRIRNENVRKIFYSIPCVQNTIAARQADFIGKMI